MVAKAKKPPAYNDGWNDAIDAAANLLSRGYTWVRRPLDPKTMTHQIDIYPGHAKISGNYLDATHCTDDENGTTSAAVLSLTHWPTAAPRTFQLVRQARRRRT